MTACNDLKHCTIADSLGLSGLDLKLPPVPCNSVQGGCGEGALGADGSEAGSCSWAR